MTPRAIVLTVACAAALSACNQPQSAPPPAAVPGGVAPAAAADDKPDPDVLPESLLINGEVIAIEDVLKPLRAELPALARRASAAEYQRQLDERLRTELLKQVETKLIIQAAAVDVGEERVKQALEQAIDQQLKSRINREFDGRHSRFEDYLREERLTMTSVREELREEIIVSTYLREQILPRIARPTRQELWDFYQQHVDDFTREGTWELFLIDISFGEDEAAARSAAAEAAGRLAAGEPFEDVARQYSRGIHRSDGGAWGEIKSAMHGRYAPVTEALFDLSENEVSEVVGGEGALFIVRAGRVRPAERQAFTDVQPLLAQRYRAVQFERRRRRLLQNLLDQAVVEPDPEYFRQALMRAAPAYAEALSEQASPGPS